MKQKMNLRKLEKSTVSAIFQTGLVEIEIGLILTVSALAMIFENISYFIDIFYFVPAVFIVITLRTIAYPRMGVVNFTKSRVKKRLLVSVVTTAVLVTLVLFTFLGNSDEPSGSVNPRLIISGIVFIICLSIAISLNYTRMYIYSFLFVGIFNLSEEIRENSWGISENGLAYLLGAAILFVIGLVYLVRFIKKYPLPGKGISIE